VRRTPDGPAPYELIVGTRRHWSVSWLHANHHSQIELIARIETLDDEGAFRLADIENREREDVTDLERARNYLHAVEAYYGGCARAWPSASPCRRPRSTISCVWANCRTR
jgi:ParB family chromosome partitioning protein